MSTVFRANTSTLADTLDSAKSTIHNHLATLVDEGLLVREGGEYDIGLRLLEFGEYARNRRPCYAVEERKAYRLAEATNCSTNSTGSRTGVLHERRGTTERLPLHRVVRDPTRWNGDRWARHRRPVAPVRSGVLVPEFVRGRASESVETVEREIAELDDGR
jgi:hypothetical protein